MADCSAISALHGDCFPDEPWSQASVAQIMALDGAFGLNAWRRGQLGGFVLARSILQECEILSLAVAPAWRRYGLGRALLHGTAAHATLIGARIIHLEVAEDNHAAGALYQSEKFKIVGRRPNYYLREEGRRVAAILYSREV